MRFGMDKEEAQEQAGPSTFLRSMRDGDQTFRIAQEPDEWVYFYEHYNPNGFPFPCTNDKDLCPGCTSQVERMARRSQRVAFNVIEGEYTNAWKVPKTVAAKLENRAERIGTITDREYTITRMKTGTGDTARYDFDIEGGTPTKTPIDREKFHDIEALLVQAYDEAWGDSGVVAVAKKQEEQKEIQPEDPPSKPETVMTEAELRGMDLFSLFKLAQDEGFGVPPATATTADAVVDWMMAKQ